MSLYSGGGGLVSNAVDFACFEEAMRNGVSLNGTSILGPKIVNYMAANHLSADSGFAGFGEQPGVAAVETAQVSASDSALLPLPLRMLS